MVCTSTYRKGVCVCCVCVWGGDRWRWWGGEEVGKAETSYSVQECVKYTTKWFQLVQHMMCYLGSLQEVQLLGPGATHCSHRG